MCAKTLCRSRHKGEVPVSHDAVTGLLSVLDLASSEARTTEDIFTGQSHPMPGGRVYGGQVLAQAMVAAERTAPEDRVPHSMHGYFLRPGDASQSITFSVDRIHDGRSFSTRRTQAFQEGVPIFSMIASFEREAPGLHHQIDMPADIPAPETLPSLAELASKAPREAHRLFQRGSIDLRHVPSNIYLEPAEVREPRQAVWMRVEAPLPDDGWVHRAVLAYLSDMTIQDAVLRANGVSWAHPGLRVASLDHAMWWHRPARVDEWLLYVQESPSASGGRGLSNGRIYTRDGSLVASVAQELMARVPELP